MVYYRPEHYDAFQDPSITNRRTYATYTGDAIFDGDVDTSMKEQPGNPLLDGITTDGKITIPNLGMRGMSLHLTDQPPYLMGLPSPHHLLDRIARQAAEQIQQAHQAQNPTVDEDQSAHPELPMEDEDESFMEHYLRSADIDDVPVAGLSLIIFDPKTVRILLLDRCEPSGRIAFELPAAPGPIPYFKRSVSRFEFHIRSIAPDGIDYSLLPMGDCGYEYRESRTHAQEKWQCAIAILVADKNKVVDRPNMVKRRSTSYMWIAPGIALQSLLYQDYDLFSKSHHPKLMADSEFVEKFREDLESRRLKRWWLEEPSTPLFPQNIERVINQRAG